MNPPSGTPTGTPGGTPNEGPRDGAKGAAEASATPAHDSMNTREMRRILTSSFLGTAIEFYDFILYATAAAVVFQHVFFTDTTPALATFYSFATMAVGYVARPIGGVIFGHFGDKVGRKQILIVSMMMMGIASTLIGLLPTTAQIGVLAPILLVLLRVAQGIAVGGEWGGATLIAMEHAPKNKRGFAASFSNMGGPFGAVLGTAVMSIFALLPDEQFLTWGWRVPFLLSAVLIVIGMVVRLKVTESPLFAQLVEKAEAKQVKVPIVEVLTRYPKPLLIGIVAGLSIFVCQGFLTVWTLEYATSHGLPRAEVLNVKTVSALLQVVMVVVSARLSDRFGRRPVIMTAALAGAVCAWPLLQALQTNTMWGFVLTLIVGSSLIQGTMYGAYGALVAELFPTRVRYSGASLTYQSASTFGAGFAPMIVAGVIAATGSMTVVAIGWAAIFLATTWAVFSLREGRNTDLSAVE
ncbi:MHS family MFS transporter [Micrococcales bacterium 31B]|nr:MHS family MFS transporter [Micrococcales bacterium 31B]